MVARSPSGSPQGPVLWPERTGELPAGLTEASAQPLSPRLAEDILKWLARRRELIAKRDDAENLIERAEYKRKLNAIDRRLREAGIDPSREARQ